MLFSTRNSDEHRTYTKYARISSKVVLLLNAAFGSLKPTSSGSRWGVLGSFCCRDAAAWLLPEVAAAVATDRNRRWWSRPPAKSWLRDASCGCCRLHASRTSPSWTRDAWGGVEDTLRETKLLHRATERRNAITQPERNVDDDGGTAGLKTRPETEKDTHDTGFFFRKGPHTNTNATRKSPFQNESSSVSSTRTRLSW